MTTIVPVVEGPGDVASLPILLSRILLERYNRPDVVVAHGKTMVVKANGRPKLENRFEEISSNTLKTNRNVTQSWSFWTPTLTAL